VTITGADLTHVRGLRTTTPARTWCDLAAIGLRLPELVAVGDAAIHHKTGLCTLRDLRRALARFEGRRGTAVMRAAIELLNPRADSPPESELRVAMVLAGLPHPSVNEPIPLPGSRIATPDLSWPRWRIAVEYEGDHHRTSRDQWRKDLARYNELADLGWRVVRATGTDYEDPGPLISRLTRLLPREGT
jgi:hypothetical protein